MMTKRSHFLRQVAGLVCGTALLTTLCSSSADAATRGPQGRRCRNVGPIAEEATWCGCTWGVVYVNGQPVDGARITF